MSAAYGVPRVGLVIGDCGDKPEGQIRMLRLGADRVSQRMRQGDRLPALLSGRDQSEADVLEQKILAAAVLDIVLRPVTPVPCAAGPEEDLIGSTHQGVPFRPLAAEDIVHQHLEVLGGVLKELEVLQAHLLVIQQLARGRIQSLAPHVVVVLPEVGAVVRAVPEAKPFLNHTFVHRLLGRLQHVLEGKIPALDPLGQGLDLSIAPA